VSGQDFLDTRRAGPATIRGSALRMIGYVAGILVSVGSATLIVRHLGVVDFGHYITVLSLVTISAGLTDAGLTTLGVQEFATRPPEERERFLRNLLGIRLTLTAAGVVGALAFAVLAGYERTLITGTALASAALLLQVSQSALTVPLAAGLKLGSVAVLDLVRQVGTFTGVLALSLAGASLLPFYAIGIPVGLLVLALNVPLARTGSSLTPLFDLSLWRGLLSGIAALAASTAIFAMYYRVTVVIMSLVSSDLETGYFATSFRIVEMLIAIPPLLVSSALPVLARAARDDHERLGYAVRRLLEAGVLAGALLAVVVVTGAAFAIHVIAGSKSDPSIAVLRVQGVAVLATFVGTACQFALLSLRRFRSLVIANSVGLVASMTLTLILADRHGAIGAAVATSVAEGAIALASVLLLASAKSDLSFTWSVIPKAALSAAAACAALLLPLGELGTPLVAAVVFLVIAWATRAVPLELVDAFMTPLRRARRSEP
jgi:O-antigen/teichoic acid export membrane protein